MIKKLCDTSHRPFKNLLSVHRLFVCVFFTFPAFIISDEDNNITVFESDVNYTMYNYSFENMTIFNQSLTDFENDNKTSDVATELESTISVTEDSDNTFQTESNRKLFRFLTPDEDICNCDLTSNLCDINCCCDPDCEEEDMQVFSDCSHQVLTPDENYCYQKDIIFRNNTVYKMVKSRSSSMFCIIHDNFKHRLRFKDMPILKSHRDLSTVLKYKYSTTYSWDTDSENQFESSELRAGSPIYVDVASNKKRITNRWSLPSSCLSDACSCREEVRFLREFRSSCSYRIRDLSGACHERNDLLTGRHVTGFCVGARHSESESSPDARAGNASDEGPGRAAAADLCVGRPDRRPRWDGDRGECRDVVAGVHFTVERDASGGIAGIGARFRYADVGRDREWITQDYGVTFLRSDNATTSSDPPERRSGNPGYRAGLPILASVNGSEEEPSSPPGKSVLGVPAADSDGFCRLDGERRTVGFGKNLRTGCVLRRRGGAFADCGSLRAAVSRLLLGPSPPVFVGAFGNANASDPDDWIEIFHDPASTDPATDDGCLASLDLRVDVVYAAVGTLANPQNKIVGVSCRRSAPRPVDPACTGTGGGRQPQECADVLLSTSVSFFDVTLPAVEHRAKVPSVDANLPADFFYPFLYSAAPGLRVACPLLLALSLALLG